MDRLPQEIQEIIKAQQIGTDGAAPKPINTVFVLRGIPGSGKSTFANKMHYFCSMTGITKTICNADEWFYVHGAYVWQASGLGKAHAYSKGQFALALLERHQVIVVDNTNYRREHFMWYVDNATSAGYEVVIVEWKPRYENDAREATKRSPHVPRDYDGWRKMFYEWEKVPEDSRVQVVTYFLDFEWRARRNTGQTEDAGPGGFYRSDDEGYEALLQINYRGRGFERDATFGSAKRGREWA